MMQILVTKYKIYQKSLRQKRKTLVPLCMQWREFGNYHLTYCLQRESSLENI